MRGCQPSAISGQLSAVSGNVPVVVATASGLCEPWAVRFPKPHFAERGGFRALTKYRDRNSLDAQLLPLVTTRS